jgi:hypothetical protein
MKAIVSFEIRDMNVLAINGAVCPFHRERKQFWSGVIFLPKVKWLVEGVHIDQNLQCGGPGPTC